MTGKDRVETNPLILDFNVEEIGEVSLTGPALLTDRGFMSPYVWVNDAGGYEILMRAVLKSGRAITDTGVIWHGHSDDGVTFAMNDGPAIVPGPDASDVGGCEDPTPMLMEDGSYVVYYTGVCADFATGQMLYATGPSVDALTKRGVALASSKTRGNTKEATVMMTADGHWRLFYEYAEGNASLIGLARGDGVAGPWHERPTPISPREKSWDNWHLSTGPLLLTDPDRPVMFYNGATRDARWRIGWAAFDRDCQTVVARGIQPLITPPPIDDRTATDIAFAASVVVEKDGTIWLYYSLEDCKLARARIRQS